MIKVFIFYLLVIYSTAKVETLTRSNLNTNLITSGNSITLAGHHNVYHPNMVGPGAFWIWSSEGLHSPPGKTLSFETLFFANCGSPIELNITADNSFKAYLDGMLVAKGNDWRTIYSVTMNISCGSHNLTIVTKQGYS